MSAAPTVVVVVAMARNRVIGRDGDMPWHLPGDLKRLKALTWGKPLIMGRRTWDSIGRPLPGRTSIVVTRDPAFSAEGAAVVRDFDAAFAAARDDARERGCDEIIAFGGASVYAWALPIAGRLEITEIDVEPDGDTWFPEIESSDWREVNRQAVPATDDAPAHRFLTFERLFGDGNA